MRLIQRLAKGLLRSWVQLSKQISVIGLGYVGLPLAVLTAKSGFKVIGVDSDTQKVELLNSGRSPVEGVTDEDVKKLVSKNRFLATSDYVHIRNSEIIVIAVPTPLTNIGKSDLSHLESAVKSVAKNMSNGTLIILESTVSPGTTRNFVMTLIKNNSKIEDVQIDLAFSPERIDPLNKIWNLKNTPKLVAGINENSKFRAIQFYSKFIEKIVECETLEIAETAKLLENTFRLINISFINELAIYCQKSGINTGEVIKAAATKPYGFMPFFPSLGIGGHCIPVDPVYLMESANDYGSPIEMIDLAVKINKKLPSYFIEKAKEKIGTLIDKKILILGVSYKPNIADVRETPAEALILELRSQGAHVFWHDELVKKWKGEESVELSANFDLAILATYHDYFDLNELAGVPLLHTQGTI